MRKAVIFVKLNIFGPFSGYHQIYMPFPHEKNYTVIYVTSEKDISSFTKVYRTSKNACFK